MEKKLYRNPNDRVLGGVAAALSAYFDLDVTWVRILFILAAVFGLSGLFIYIILWIAIPEQPFSWNAQTDTDYRVNSSEAKPAAEQLATAPLDSAKKGNSKNIAGLILIFLGFFFLFREFDLIPYWFRLGKLWPLVFIIPGLVMLANSTKSSTGGNKRHEGSSDKTPAEQDQNTSIH